jgi:hypothetical protein
MPFPCFLKPNFGCTGPATATWALGGDSPCPAGGAHIAMYITSNTAHTATTTHHPCAALPLRPLSGAPVAYVGDSSQDAPKLP